MAAENGFSRTQQENWRNFQEPEEDNTSISEDDDVLEGFLQELDVKGHEMMKKLIAKVENDVPLEEAFRETWHHIRGKHASQMLEKIAKKMEGERDGGLVRRERGVDDDGLQAELKNERFKVKTLNVIKEEVAK